MRPSPFDHRQDRELGDALRLALTGQNEEAFVNSVVACAALLQAGGFDSGDWWDILSEWARPGLAAAAIGLAAATALWWTGMGDSPNSVMLLDDPLQASAEIPAAFLTAQPPDIRV